MRKLFTSIGITVVMAVAVILGGASPARAELLCGGMLLTTSVYPGVVGAESRCKILGHEVNAGAFVFSYSGMAGAGAGAGDCYPDSNPHGYACINPQSFAKVDTAGNVFVLNSVCFTPYPCDWVVVYALPGSGAGVEVYEFATGSYERVNVPL